VFIFFSFDWFFRTQASARARDYGAHGGTMLIRLPVNVTGAQAGSNTHTIIKTETSKLRVFIFSPLVEMIFRTLAS
jgi:hypothetical protein